MARVLGSFLLGDGYILGTDDPSAPPGFSPGQVQLGDLVLGPGTPYALVSFNPWGEADVRSNDTVRAQVSGSMPAVGLFGGRRVEFTLYVRTSSPAAARTAANVLSAAFAPDPEGDVSALIWNEGGAVYRLHGQTRGVSVDPGDLNVLLKAGQLKCTVRFLATDPNVLSDTGHSITVNARTTATVPVPLAVPLAWTTPSGGTGTVSNAGTGNTYWRAEIDGPAVDPSIENTTTGEVLRFSGQLATGDALLVDSELRSYVIDGGSQISLVSPASWWTFPPGSTGITYRGGGSLLMSWRDAWTP